MKHAFAASTLLALAAAVPQGGPPNHPGGPGAGIFSQFPSCANSCWSNVQSSCSSATDYSCFCGSDVVSSANSCIASSSCTSDEKNQVYEAVAQLCADAGATVTASPEATWSATSGGAQWPSAWTTGSDWATVTSAFPWSGGPGGHPGWTGNGGWGPFGHGGGPGQNGWGPWGSSGAWTNGPWTSWWGTAACPASTWSGWTNGPWGTSAPWTTWSGCTATTTATSVATTTAGNGTVVTTTNYGIKVAQVTNGGSSSSGSTSSSAGAAAPRQTGFGLAASAAGALGVLGGALLL